MRRTLKSNNRLFNAHLLWKAKGYTAVVKGKDD